MRITQGTFSFLPDLTDEQIAAQVLYALENDWVDARRINREAPGPARLAVAEAICYAPSTSEPVAPVRSWRNW